ADFTYVSTWQGFVYVAFIIDVFAGYIVGWRVSSSMETTFVLDVNRPGFPGECFICELRLPDHRFRWKHNKLFLLLPEEYGPAFP
ncbi:DDE-type integrase/transposase/recombinase, partial [Escherichia coli]|uniref:DDE-type integrase/transposase/recombinase n=1 Tax=Escherichia coli TaxID=562 RepID=UPI00391F73B8